MGLPVSREQAAAIKRVIEQAVPVGRDWLDSMLATPFPREPEKPKRCACTWCEMTRGHE